MRAMTLCMLAVGMSVAACNPDGVVFCPPVTKYSPEFQRRAAVELRGLPQNSAVAQMIVDYGKLRDACRAVEKRR